jgi:hypothetical protein
MEFIGTGEEIEDEFSPNVSTLLLHSTNFSVAEGMGGDRPTRFLENQFYSKSVVVQNTRSARKRIVL